MNDFSSFEKTIVRELSCRLCLCTDVIKLKPLNAELKRKIKKLFDISVNIDDSLPKAICHDCLQQVGVLHLYAVKVDKIQKFLNFHKLKSHQEKHSAHITPNTPKMHPVIGALSSNNVSDSEKANKTPKIKSPPSEQGDIRTLNNKRIFKRNTPADMKFLEAMPLEEFVETEKVDKSLLNSTTVVNNPHIKSSSAKKDLHKKELNQNNEFISDTLDPIVIIDGRPAKQGAVLDRSLMKHYKERHGVPGYVSCCDKKFHYFYPKKIIEHMAYHLQPNIFMCASCHQNFKTSQELVEHQSNGGRSEGKILCPRCTEKYPTYRELGWHVITHRTDKLQCDYCGKVLKHHHRKKAVNHMEDVLLCSTCIRTLKKIEKQEKEIKEKIKNENDSITLQKHSRFRQAMEFSGDEDGSTD